MLSSRIETLGTSDNTKRYQAQSKIETRMITLCVISSAWCYDSCLITLRDDDDYADDDDNDDGVDGDDDVCVS